MNQPDTERMLEILLPSLYGGCFSHSSHDAECKENECRNEVH